jgi:signal transduction histidine kinase
MAASGCAELAAERRSRTAVMTDELMARERQRIIADLHDGLGAALFGLLQHIKSGRASLTSIERHVHDAIRELRIAVDGLLPHSHDIETMLGSVRYRMEDTIRTSGAVLEWRVEKLPPRRYLNPSGVCSLQRIVVEAIVNAIRHSRCRRITVAARVLESQDLEIAIVDDGCGFHPRRGEGLGLRNIRARANGIGAQLAITPRADGGTTLRLLLPVNRKYRAIPHP